VLALGAMRVVFNSSTTFRGEHEFEDGEAHESAAPLVSQAGFVPRLPALLAAGRHPSVEVDRQPLTMPQGPIDSTFFAAVVRLDEAADRPGIAMNVSAANFLANATPPPDAWLQVLNRKIELRVSDGTTRIEQRGPRTTGELHFEGMVSSVDATAGTATLADGTILRIVAGTEIDGAVTDPDDGSLASLAAVKAALMAGSSVIAKGDAVLETASPRTLDVIEVRFRLMDDIDFATPD
jgi:hypothetical protein